MYESKFYYTKNSEIVYCLSNYVRWELLKQVAVSIDLNLFKEDDFNYLFKRIAPVYYGGLEQDIMQIDLDELNCKMHKQFIIRYGKKIFDTDISNRKELIILNNTKASVYYKLFND